MQSTQTLFRKNDLWIGKFFALGCDCEILMQTENQTLATSLFENITVETLRIQHKLSRYEKNNLIWQINHAQGQPIQVDDETAQIIDYAAVCFELSDGLFDITSGVLSKLWKIIDQKKIPSTTEIEQLLPLVGWQKASWENKILQLPAGMQIDLGGIGKEYAVDVCVQLAKKYTDIPVLINFGGDLAVSSPKKNQQPWQLGIESPLNSQVAIKSLDIFTGAITTSGDAKRSFEYQGERYSHILNPKTGWPMTHTPRSVTVAAATCTQAGTLSTLAMLQGAEAENFLSEQGVAFWCLREESHSS